MSDLVEDVDSLSASVTRQGAVVRKLKQEGANAQELIEAVHKLKQLKLDLEQKTSAADPPALNKRSFEDLLIRKMYVVPSFEIYGGVAGFYDFGPPACALKANLLALWRQHFVQQENFLEIECTNIMPEIVLQTSGHVEKFTDLMVKDLKTGDCHRADKLVEDHIENLLIKNRGMLTHEQMEEHRLVATKAESLSPADLHAVIQKYEIKGPGTGNDLSEPIPFNLMFKCSIGPQGHQIGYLRPETAQGIFLNFRRLLDYNSGRVPFGTAQIGNAFRNEISPRGGLLRVREFQQAEIEYFVNPKDKSHAKFSSIAKVVLTLFPKQNQLGDGKTIQLSAQDAVKQGIIANESLAYFLARTWSFMQLIGVDCERVRFRQHLDTEMAHYACDCWDLEIKMHSGWIECAGHADRSCYDLAVHAKKSKVEMMGTLKYDVPRMVEIVDIKLNKGKIGREFKKDASIVIEALTDICENMEEAIAFEAELQNNSCNTLGPLCDNQSYKITREMVSFKKITKKMSEEKFVPSVIEPSFGIGRILNAVLEHSFSTREEDENRGVMSFKPLMAPIKVSILPLSSNSAFNAYADQLEQLCRKHLITYKVDTSSVAIGRKYARADELGIPFNVTIDFETVENRTVTLRERDSCQQIRLRLSDVSQVLRDLSTEFTTFSNLMKIYPIVQNSPEVDSTKPTVVEVTLRGRFSRPSVPVTSQMTRVESKPVAENSFNEPAPIKKQLDAKSIAECVEKIVAKGNEIRQMKADKADKASIKEQVVVLLALKAEYKNISGEDFVPST